jgi:hypothetical protein
MTAIDPEDFWLDTILESSSLEEVETSRCKRECVPLTGWLVRKEEGKVDFCYMF